MSLEEDKELQKAKGYALRLFKLRPRSIGELREKLKGKGYSSEVGAKIIVDFTAWGYLDDEAFTRAWLQSRLKKYGFRRVQRELIDKGVSKDLIAAVWQDVREGHDELAAALEIAKRRMAAQQRQDVPPLKQKKRLMDYLLRRGFSMEVVLKILRMKD